jgi:Ca2+-binding EF-hand superfamily protein
MHRRLLDRFDADRDGVLGPDERAAARQFTEQRRREHEQRMADVLRRFDADGDGRLDARERAAARQWHQQDERP